MLNRVVTSVLSFLVEKCVVGDFEAFTVVHKKFINAVTYGKAETEKQIHVIAEELANRSSIDKKSKKLLALSVELVILERMGKSTENATRQLARLSSENVSENTSIDTAADEQNNSDYDFDEMDEEWEIPPQGDSQAISSEPNPEPISEQN